MGEEGNSAGGWSWAIGLAIAGGALLLVLGRGRVERTLPAPVPTPVVPVAAPIAEPDRAVEVSKAPSAVPHYQPEMNRPLEELSGGYVGAAACRECHQHNHSTWFASYHRTMTQKPGTDSVMGDFDNAGFTNHSTGYAFRMTREDEQFFITVEPPPDVDHQRHPHPKQTYHLKWPVSLLTGSHHMQGYWVPEGRNHTMSLAPVMYLKEAQRWISRSSAFLEPPGRRHIFEEGSWNQVCIQCHATHGETRRAREGGLESRVAEFGISCEACHGPGEKHVKLRREAGPSGTVASDPVVNPRSLSHERSSQVCGACHGRTWIKDRAKPRLYRPGGDLFANRYLLADEPEVTAAVNRYLQDHKMPDGVTNAAGLLRTFFWSDGMARVSSAEYNGMVKSPCYQQGQMSCFSCHQLHQSRADKRPPKEWANDQLRHDRIGDKACIQCHQEPRYASPDHTHHPIGSSGSECLNCHQPYTSYGLMKAIRSHTVSSPSVAQTLETGRPNACNLCHLDRSLGWTAGYLAEWHDVKTPPLNDDQREISAVVLDALKGDASLRALAASAMGWQPATEVSGTDWLAPYLAVLMEDPYDAVRFIAARSLRKQSKYRELPYDFLGNPRQRREMVLALNQQWMEARQSGYRQGERPALLIETNGLLNMPTFIRLQKERDNRPIGLNE